MRTPSRPTRPYWNISALPERIRDDEYANPPCVGVIDCPESETVTGVSVELDSVPVDTVIVCDVTASSLALPIEP